MRFRANVEDVGSFFSKCSKKVLRNAIWDVLDFRAEITQAIEKLQKRCIIKFTESHMHIICNHDASEGGVQVWSQVKVQSLFRDYRIQSNSNNEITFLISPEALLLALRSAWNPSSLESTPETVMKLAKKNDQAVLSFDISGSMSSGRLVRVGHDVRIEVMKPSDVKRLSEPMCPEPDVHILLPPLQKLRTIVERLRPLSDVIAVRCNNNGKLEISVQTEGVRVDTQWSGCTNPKMAQEGASQNAEAGGEIEKPDPDQLFCVLISIKSFIKFLNSHVLSSTTIACICQGHCVILYVYIGDFADAGGVLTFYIPAHIDS